MQDSSKTTSQDSRELVELMYFPKAHRHTTQAQGTQCTGTQDSGIIAHSERVVDGDTRGGLGRHDSIIHTARNDDSSAGAARS